MRSSSEARPAARPSDSGRALPVAVSMNVGFGLCTLGSAMWLWKKSRWWDTVAVSAAEVGLVFTGLTLVTGMVWGRPTWGVYWTWDARLTSFSLLFLLYLGYLVVRHLPAEVEARHVASQAARGARESRRAGSSAHTTARRPHRPKPST